MPQVLPHSETLGKPKSTATLLLNCPDQKGLVANIAQFIFKHGGNILYADQHQDRESGNFLMRVEWDLREWDLDDQSFQFKFKDLATQLSIDWQVAYSNLRPKVAIMVSQFDHCLLDLLYRNRIGELDCEISLIISNHLNAKQHAEFYKIPFYYTPIDSKSKVEVEKQQLQMLEKNSIDLIILARYMQILSAEFVKRYVGKIINIHHSFLPAFIGAKPYHQAFQRGVKVIGATSHYVTESLDEGPIIHQDVMRISHRDQISDLIRKGRDLERLVLSKAIKWHLDNRIVIYNKRTVIFDD